MLSTFLVTDLSDNSAGSLRTAIAAANANPGADTIEFATTGTIALTSGQLDITDSLAINGQGESALTVSGEGVSRVFALVGNPTVVIADLTVANGWTTGSPGGGISMTEGTLTLARCTVFGNTAVGVHGTSSYPLEGGEGAGGGIYVAGGTLNLDHVTVSGNQAYGGLGYGGYFEPYGYAGGRGSGGGLYVAGGAVHVNQSIISGNYATGGTGGDSDQQYWAGWLDTYGGNGGNAAGGGIVVVGGTLEISQSTLFGNAASGGFGGAGAYYGWPGVGVGGGIDTPADPPSTYLDTFTVDHTISNSPDDIVGPYVLNGTPPPPNLAVSDVTVLEGNGATTVFAFTVTLSAPSGQPVTVAYGTADGTATSGSDYQTATGTLTFAPGETQKAVTVLVNGDMTFEPDESFYVNLTNAGGATIADGQGVGTIVNDDVPLPSLTVSDVSKKERNSGTTSFSFVVTLSAPSNAPVTVQYATADGTANVNGRDYYAKSGTLTFQPGQTSKTVTVSVRGDRTREADETFFLTLANSQGATIGDGQGLGTIQDDDGSAWAALINDLALSQTGRKRH